MICAGGTRTTRGLLWSQLAICVGAACATSVEGQPQFSVNRSADFSKIESVAVFGIFRNGRMSPGSWADFGAALSAPFSQKACEAVYTNDLINTNAELTAAVDDYAKENGVSDELLDQFDIARLRKARALSLSGGDNTFSNTAVECGVYLLAPSFESRAAVSARFSRVHSCAFTMALTTFCDHSGRCCRSRSCIKTTQQA